jgi:hypothetical protein
MRSCGRLTAPSPALRLFHALFAHQAVIFAFALARMKSSMRATPLFTASFVTAQGKRMYWPSPVSQWFHNR